VGFIFKTINDNMNIGKKFLSDLKLHSDYLKWKEAEGRYETWEDACESIIEGHRQRYGNLPNLEEHLQVALKAIKSKQVLASQRNLQYRFPQIKTNNERLYNCVGVLFNKNDYFQKAFHVLLSGCGLDFSLRKLFIKQLSTIQTRTRGTKTYVIPDSIDGWADSLGVLMSSYFTDNAPFPEYMGYEIKFDFSLIRPKGAFISGGFKAPGPDGLKQSLEKIETLINNWINARGNIIESILVYDIIMHAADAVLSGGVRRSACSVLIDEDDEEMIQAKLGNWRQTNPQRARSNNAVGLHRNSFSQEKLKSIIDLNQGDNDISFIFVHDEYEVSNPCFSGDMKILTEKGYKTFEEIGESEVSLIDGSGNIKDAKVSISGVKKLIELKFRNRTSIKCTPQHVFLTTEEEEVEAQYLKGQRIAPYLNQTLDFNKEYIKYGFLQGDGCLGRLNSAAHKGLEINLNKKDIEISDLFEIENKQTVYINGYNEILNSLGFNSKPLPERELPLTIKEWEEKNLISFLRGLWSANGSIITNTRISFKSTCKNLIDQLSEILNSLGYNNYYTTNKPKVVTFSNGDYVCKESYDLNIADYLSMEKFYNNIGFEQEYKNKALKQLLINKAPVVSSIKELSGIHKVYDFSIKDTVLPWGIVEGVIAHNCREITFRPILEDGRTGFQMCVAPNTKLITKKGIEKIGEVADNNLEVEIWNGEKWSKVKPIKTGIDNKLYRVNFNDGSYLDANANHKFLVKDRFQKEFKEKTTLELIHLLNTTNYALQVPRFKMEYNEGISELKAYDYGYILGDGTCRSYENGRLRKPFASVFESNFHLDFPFITGTKSKILTRDNRGKQSKYYNVSFDVDFEFSEKLKYAEGLPKEIFTWNKESIINFLAGWIDSDGTVTYNNKIRVYGKESKIRDLQLLLTKIGTNSSVNLASKKGDITNYSTRKRDLWYIQISNCEGLWCTKTKLYKTEVSAKGKYQNIKNIEELEGISDVYCFEELELHQGVFNNVLTKQCNLTEINASACKTEGEFYSACVAASILGTLQAGYTHFPYLGKDTEDLVRREALIGVSITGWMNNPMLFNPIILSTGAKFVKLINEDIASIININPAARTTTVKPSGNASVILGTASGIHPEHSRRYFRIMQLNKESDTAKWLEENMPVLLENSVWSATNSDYVVYVPIENPEEGFYKKDMKGVKHLEFIKMVQQYWVNEGTNEVYCLKPWLRHSVSCTVIVDDIEKITEYIFSNQDDFKAVSFISDYGDKDFNQAPFTSVSTIEEIVSTYGKGALFVSGLIVDGLHYFSNDLWSACDMILKSDVKIFGTKEQVMLKKYWLSRAKKFANNFFNGDLQQMIYCLKDVHLLHKWEVINREFKPTNFGEILSKPKFKDISDYAAVSCSGGACEIVNIN